MELARAPMSDQVASMGDMAFLEFKIFLDVMFFHTFSCLMEKEKFLYNLCEVGIYIVNNSKIEQERCILLLRGHRDCRRVLDRYPQARRFASICVYGSCAVKRRYYSGSSYVNGISELDLL